MEKNDIEIVSITNNSNTFDFKKGKISFSINLIVNTSLSILIKTKIGKIYEGIYTYEDLVKNKMLRIYDDIQEIHHFIQLKLIGKSFQIEFSDDKSEIILESLIEGKKFQMNLIFTLVKEVEPQILIEDLFRTNYILEEKVLSLEKEVEELKIKNQNFEERLKKIENTDNRLWDKDSLISCWKCGKKNDGTFWKKPYLKNDGRCDQFVNSGFWGTCRSCDPINTYLN